MLYKTKANMFSLPGRNYEFWNEDKNILSSEYILYVYFYAYIVSSEMNDKNEKYN